MRGSEAPEFEAGLWDGSRYRLVSGRGRKVWLAFFRYVGCPMCNVRVHHMIQRFGDYRSRGLDVVAVFQSPAHKVADYMEERQPPFPLICDPEERLYALYGLEAGLSAFVSARVAKTMVEAAKLGVISNRGADGTRDRIPADFLIDEEGQLLDVFYGTDIADHIPFERVDAILSA